MNNKEIIEIDCDGVLVDLVNTAIRMYSLTSMPYPYYPATYSLQDAGSDRNALFAALSDPKVIEQCELYPDTVTFLSKLSESLNNSKYKVDVRTLLMNEGCKEARERYLLNLIKRVDPKLSVFTCTPVVGEHVDSKDAKDDIFIYVEDYVNNLIKSNAKYKILINRSYNQEADCPELKTIDYIRVNNLDECYTKIMEVIT